MRAVIVAVVSVLLATAPRHAAAEPGPLVDARDGVEIDWVLGTVTVAGGAAADLRMPSADVARAGAVRRAESVARARLATALAAVPLGGGRKPTSEAVERAVGRARVSQADYQSNGGAVVRVTARFSDWLEHPADAPAITLAASPMHLGAAPLVKVGGRELALGAAIYRVGPPPRDAKALAVKTDKAGRLVIEASHKDADLPQKLARGTALIYVEKVLK